MFENRVGRGRVLSVACDRFLPERYAMEAGRNGYQEEYERISSCRQTFELLRFLLARIQEESMPVRVSGDVEFGMNATGGGLLVWLFNNKGVVKFADEPERLDSSKTAYVTIDFKGSPPDAVRDVETGELFPGGEIHLLVKPGGWRLLQVERR